MEDFDAILASCRKYNELEPQATLLGPPNGSVGAGGDRPGDDFNARATWEEILLPHGWSLVTRQGERCCWKRPGKNGPGSSATTGFCRNEGSGDLLYVFSTNAYPFESERCYSRYSAHTLLNHGGDFSAAAKDLASRGYGKQAETIEFTATNQPGKANSILPSREENSSTSSAEEVPGLLVKLVSQLDASDAETNWLWHGYLCLNGITLFSALWKAGKTTLLAHLVKALASNGMFCGLRVRASQVLYVTEEHESLWASRRDALGLEDPLRFVIRPFSQKPSMDQWIRFLVSLQAYCRLHPVQLIVFDTISNLWPVKDENDAARVQEALMPLHAVGNDIAFLLVHHLRKNDGAEATGARGSGALPAFVDTLMELRRYNAGDRKDTRRVLTGYGRYQETTDEVVIELQRDPECYVAHGDKQQVVTQTIEEVLLRPQGPMAISEPGKTDKQIYEDWPNETSKPSWNIFHAALKEGVEKGLWAMTPGKSGRGGYPALFWRPPVNSYSNSEPYRGSTQSPNAAAEEQDPFPDAALEKASKAEILVTLRVEGACEASRLAALTNQNEEDVKRLLFELWEAQEVQWEEFSDGRKLYTARTKEDQHE